MKNKFLIVVCLAFTVSFFSIQGKPEIIYRGQTKEEAFSYAMHFIKNLPWYYDNGYKVSLPIHKDFNVWYQCPYLLEEKDEYEYSLKKVFYEEIYDASTFEPSLGVICQSDDIIQKALQKLAVLEKHWGFKILQQYNVVLTLYGPSGNYMIKENDVSIIIKVNEDTLQLTKKKYTQTIVHEIVHIGIEENIIQKYNLALWEKERLVDLICSLYLKDLVPWYQNQEIVTDKKIDSFIDKEVIVDNLPAAIERFIAQNPRV